MRYPIIHQPDGADCGAAAIAMIAEYHGARISIARLRQIAGTHGLTAAATRVGFAARTVRSTIEGLHEMTLPVVAHWREDNRDRHVTVYKISRNRIIVGDPAGGLRQL